LIDGCLQHDILILLLPIATSSGRLQKTLLLLLLQPWGSSCGIAS
jgi:hypothetical protein